MNLVEHRIGQSACLGFLPFLVRFGNYTYWLGDSPLTQVGYVAQIVSLFFPQIVPIRVSWDEEGSPAPDYWLILAEN